VSNTDFNRNYFFRNDGNLFSEVASSSGVEFRSDKTHSAEFADYDNDGDLDLLIGNNDSAGPYRLLRNDGGIFKDRTLAAGLNPTTIHFRGSAFGDFDNDGFLDLIVAINTLGRKIALYHNNGSGTFTDITATAGLDTLIPTLTLAVADFDNDGKLDIYCGSGVNTVKDQIYRNVSIAKNWLKLRLIGTASNKSGIGVWLQLSAKSRQYRQVVAGKGYKSQDDLTQHFGVGEATIIDSLKIEWPSGNVQILRNISANQFLTITEPNTLPPLRNLGEVSYSKIVNRDYDVQVSINVPNPNSIKALTLYYRISGAPSFSKLPMSLQNNNTFTQIIPSTVITNRGAEFYVQAEDQYGNFVQSKRYPIRIFFPNGISNPAEQPYGKNASAYRLFSCPLELDDKSPNTFLNVNSSLGAYDKTQFRWYGVERTTQRLKEYPEFGNIPLTPGMGFALLTSIRNVKLKTGTGTTVVTTMPYNMTLPKGWSLIGNPFNYDIPFDSLRVSNGAFELWSFKGDWQINTQGLEPWKGYAIWLSQAATFSIRAGLAGLNGGASFYSVENNVGENWLLQIIADNGRSGQTGGGSRFNFAGQNESASDDEDQFDLHQPLRLADGVEVIFNNQLTTDIRRASAAGHTWELTCLINPADEMLSLAFEGIYSVPTSFEVFLIDRETQTAYNLRANPRLQFATRHLTEKHFQLVAGTKAYLNEQALSAELHPASFELLQNFPNPFSASGTFGNPSTQIIYSLPEASHVEVSVYNIRGEAVATLVNERQESGSHTVVWNAEKVGSGVYFIKMRAGRVERMRKCLLVK
jgi:hypothetical protein